MKYIKAEPLWNLHCERCEDEIAKIRVEIDESEYEPSDARFYCLECYQVIRKELLEKYNETASHGLSPLELSIAGMLGVSIPDGWRVELPEFESL
jgi:hypothetical protein